MKTSVSLTRNVYEAKRVEIILYVHLDEDISTEPGHNDSSVEPRHIKRYGDMDMSDFEEHDICDILKLLSDNEYNHFDDHIQFEYKHKTYKIKLDY